MFAAGAAVNEMASNAAAKAQTGQAGSRQRSRPLRTRSLPNALLERSFIPTRAGSRASRQRVRHAAPNNAGCSRWRSVEAAAVEILLGAVAAGRSLGIRHRPRSHTLDVAGRSAGDARVARDR